MQKEYRIGRGGVDLTPKGKSAIAASSRVAIVIGERTVAKVTGIAPGAEGNHSLAHFVWTMTPTAQAMALDLANVYGGQGTAGFQRYDDGWRVTDMRICDGACR